MLFGWRVSMKCFFDVKDYMIGSVVFFITLYSVYLFGIQFLSLVGSLIFVFLGVFSFKSVLKNHEYMYMVFFMVFFVLTCFTQMLFYDLNTSRVISFFAVFLFSIAVFLYSEMLNKKKIIGFVLSLHILAFYLQFFLYYLFGFYLDYLAFLNIDSRNFGGLYTILGKPLMRGSGFFNEPGTYSCFVAPLVVYYYRYLALNKNSIVFYASVLSLALSFSTFGFVFFILIVSFLVKKNYIKFLFVSLLSIPSIPYIYWKLYINPLAGGSSATDFRQQYIYSFFEKLSDLKFLVAGNGVLSEEVFIGNKFAVNDTGLLVYVFNEFGLMLGLVVVCFFIGFYFKANTVGKLIIVIISLSKISIFSFVFPLYLYWALSSKDNLDEDFLYNKSS